MLVLFIMANLQLDNVTVIVHHHLTTMLILIGIIITIHHNLIDLKHLSHEGSKFKYSFMFDKSLWSSGVNVSRFIDFNKKR